VAHLISSKSGIGGAEKVVAGLSRGAGAYGWQTAIVNPFAATPDTEEFRALYGDVPYYQHMTQRRRQLLAGRAWTISTLRDLAPRVVHVHLYHATVLAATMTPPGDARWLLTHHYGPLFELQGRAASAQLDRRATRRLGRAVAVSESVRDYLIRRCGLNQQAASLIYNGWSGQPLPSASSGSRPTAVCVANFRPEKGHEILVRAFAEVAREVPGARLVLVGGGPLEATIRTQVAEHGLAGSVEFRGTVRDVWPVLAGAHVFVLASWYEPLGVAVLEAMAAGLPVVATAVGGLCELVKPGTTGWLVPRGDHGDLAARMVQLLTNEDMRREFGRSAAREVATKSEASMVRKYYEVYNTLVMR
jgi:glycosyltransferase involved in cell wall biosynthesis